MPYPSSSRALSRRVAFCGILAALMLVIMLLGTMIPAATFICPMLAGALSIPVLWEFGTRSGILLYLAVSVLSLILAPDKEAALMFVCLLGWYPILRPKIQHLPQKPLRVGIKLVLFNAALVAVYALLLFVFTMPDLQAEAAEWTLPLLVVMILVGNVVFLLFDLLLYRLTEQYVVRLRPKLFAHPPH